MENIHTIYPQLNMLNPTYSIYFFVNSLNKLQEVKQNGKESKSNC
jgi:hypothetical protein